MVHGRFARGAVLLLTLAVSLALSSPSSAVQGQAQAELPVLDAVAVEGAAPRAKAPALPEHNAVDDGGRATTPIIKEEQITVWDLPPGSPVFNPVSGRTEVIDPSIARTALLFGDSQAGGASGVTGAETWVQKGLRNSGYKVRFVGAGGIGFVAKTSASANYPDSVESGAVVLPYGNPALVVVQGGGNDAAAKVPDAQVLANAERLLRDLKSSYPVSEFLIVGTLAKGEAGSRRSHVDALLASFAKRNGVLFLSAGDWVTRYAVTNKMADAVHLNAKGHEVLSKVLVSKLGALQLQIPQQSTQKQG
ncbi:MULTISPECIES: SGNH/GDSL hydrolase family protein [Arthrobacter]|uniref:SGNH/GDSL hydrolase family protein n=1 Tax=unclassified Arthrobacter TaxID=235627 RepID=UPI0024B8D0AE|nr:SGNH/GDSL hydrolase family protein [Arthrobacter sp. H35-MC1]MDJ0316514.1 SGNH/GDSL hydrolase family protein [Arthrobacter sp. H35-MC1]